MTDAIWHEVECGPYAADLPLWETLAGACEGPLLELGCGTGRVALHLARHGHRVVALDCEAELVRALEEKRGDLPVEAIVGDARDFDLGRAFALVLAPMQLLQLLGGEPERVACLSRIAAHLRPGGRTALAIAEELTPDPPGTPPPLPDTREQGGWVYSSLPLETLLNGRRIIVRRLRQTVAPGGALSEAVDEIELQKLSAAELEREAASAGLVPIERLTIAPTDDHVGSTVVLLGRES